MGKHSRLWLTIAVGMLLVLIIAAVLLPRSFALTAFSDVLQCFLLFSGAAAFVPLARRSHGRISLFWSLIAFGIVLWLCYQLFWTYYEVLLRQEVPDLCIWDVVLFLHIVPFMAALALRPHVPRDEYAARVVQLDFALLLVWWFYLYVLIVMPWQYVTPDVAAYNRNLNGVYSAEKFAFLLGLFLCWIKSKGEWKKLYAALFGSGLCYSASSTLANWAIARNAYYSGSLYDVPLVFAMAWLTWIGLRTKAEKPESKSANSTVYGVWVARFSMIAAFSLPLCAAWSISGTSAPPRIHTFRLVLTFVAAIFMGIMVFIRQKMLDRELNRLIEYSRDSFDNLKRLQAQILQSEKLASVSQLVGGAAHELNNPITAMLGYSDLLLNTKLTPDQQPIATRIGQYVRRTRSLVASLISFARQTPGIKTQIDLNTLARTAIKLSQPQCESMQLEVHTHFDAMLPKIFGDSNQLLQVCHQLIADCVHVLAKTGGKILTVSSMRDGGSCVLQMIAEAPNPASRTENPSENTQKDVALSACQGILQDHRGTVTCEQREDGSTLLRVQLPPAGTGPAESSSTAPALWQSQPYA